MGLAVMTREDQNPQISNLISENRAKPETPRLMMLRVRISSIKQPT